MSLYRNRGDRRAMALLCSLSAFAISTAQAQQKPDDKPMEEVVVTGTRIITPNLESPVPVTTISGEELFQTGNTSVGDLLNDLPALRSTFSQSNSSRFLGTTGLNLLDLRGLGTQRTLVLVNGRRHVGSDILSNAVSPDTNTFPTDLIERIDVVTGGNSAVYGSDAIAGVVNFVLKQDYEGLQFRGQGGQSDEGDAGNYYGSILGGTNFMDDRGNIAFNLEYAKQDSWFATDRRNLRRVGNFVVVDTDPAGTPNGSDGVPDRLYYDDIRVTSVANGGNFMIANNAMAPGVAPCGRDSQGARWNCPYLFMPDGTLVPQTGERIGLAPSGNFNGGNGSTGREANLLAIYPDLDRYSFNLFGHLELTESFVPFIEAKYVRTESIRYGSPAFFQGGTTGDPRELVRFDNPFMSDQARAQLQAARLAAGFTDPYIEVAPVDEDDPDISRLALRRNLIEFGPRREDATRETTRIVLGVNGQMSENWRYEVALNLGRFKEDTIVKGNMNMQRFGLAMDAARNGSGQIVCRSQIDPDAAYGYDDTNPMSVSTLAADIAACVPLNPFGEGSITAAMRDYVTQDTTSVAEIKQTVISATVMGDSSGWFSLPAGAIGVALGAEHRTEENFFEADELVSSGITFYNALPLFDPPKFEVSEVFTEFRVPLLKELPFADELTLNMAGRYAEYEGDVGGVFAYNAGIDWSPVSSVRVRGGIARAVRAPSLVDLFSEQSQNFATIQDPCSFRNVGAGSSTRVANCAAAGIPGGPTGYDHVYSATPEILSGGNPELKEETSDSLTVGVVYQPEFAPGLSLSADYFDIDIDDVITAPTAQQIMNACYDAVDLNNQFCGLFQRWGAAGGPNASVDVPYSLVNGSLQQTLLNYASSSSRGIDFEVGYNRTTDDGSKVKARLIYTLMLQRDDFLDPANPNDADRVLLELGDPKDAFNFNLDFEKGPFTIGYQLRYLGKQVLFNYEDTYGLQGEPPQNADYGDRRFYPSVIYQDLRAGYDINDSWHAYLGVDNLTDKIPPLGLTGTGEGSGIYDVRARYFYAGVKVNF